MVRTLDLELSESPLLRLLRDLTDPVEQESDVGFRVARHLKLEVGGVDLGLDTEGEEEV